VERLAIRVRVKRLRKAKQAGVSQPYLWELEAGEKTNPGIVVLRKARQSPRCAGDGLVGVTVDCSEYRRDSHSGWDAGLPKRGRQARRDVASRDSVPGRLPGLDGSQKRDTVGSLGTRSERPWAGPSSTGGLTVRRERSEDRLAERGDEHARAFRLAPDTMTERLLPYFRGSEPSSRLPIVVS
jgi:hypothetical protein